MGIPAIWTLLKSGSFWLKALPYIASIAAVLGILYAAYSWSWHRGAHSRDAEVSALTGTIANFKAASAQAAADNLAHVRAVETRDAAIQQEQTDALSRQLADARAATTRYVSLHHAPADQGHARDGGLSETPAAAGAIAGAAQEAVVPVSDLDACADSFVIATGWQQWWARVSEGPKE